VWPTGTDGRAAKAQSGDKGHREHGEEELWSSRDQSVCVCGGGGAAWGLGTNCKAPGEA